MSMDMSNLSIMQSENPYESFMRKHLQYYGYFKDDSDNDEVRNKNKKKEEGKEEDEEEEMEENSVNSHGETIEDRQVESSQLPNDNHFNNSSNKCTLLDKFKNGIQGTTQLISTLAEGKMILKLQEPRGLHFMSHLLDAQSEARWPRGLDIKTNRIRHLCIVPAIPEPFYEQTGLEDMPCVRTNLKTNKVVFENRRMLSTVVLTCDPENSDYTNNSEHLTYFEEIELQFESRFESGNLARAIRVGDYDYELYLHCDLYTLNHTQWFYFQVTNIRKNVPYRFTIVNFMKSNSLYNYGMKPLMYSEKSATASIKPIGWQRIGYNIRYYKNNLNIEDATQKKSFYSLTWTFKFPYSYDTVYFAHSYPYTYSDLQEYLFKCANDAKISKFFNIRILCRTLAGNNIYILTVTNPISDTVQMKTKKAVFVTCRVHPGESNASWVMKGFLDTLTADSENSNLLRETFVFKIIPMLNPDGVIVGNYRCSLSGEDLNRNYKSAQEGRFPTIGNIVIMVKKLLTKLEVVMYCDFHSHSRKHNSFFYGCKKQGRKERKLFQEKIFPYLLAKNAPNHFQFNSCKFKVQMSRKRTSRVIMWKLGIKNSFTFEVSCCGSTIGQNKGFHFNTDDYELLGVFFLDTLLQYVNLDKCQVNSLFDELKNEYTNGKLKTEEKKLYTGDHPTSEEEDEDEDEEEEEEEEEEGEEEEEEEEAEGDEERIKLFESSDGSDSSDSDEPSYDHSSHIQLIKKKKNKSSGRKKKQCHLVNYSKPAGLNGNKTEAERKLVLESGRNYLEYLSKEYEKKRLHSRETLPLNNRQIGKNHYFYYNRTEQSPDLHIEGRGQNVHQKSIMQNDIISNILWEKIKVTSPGKLMLNKSLPLPRSPSKLFGQNGDDRKKKLRLFGSSLNKEVTENLSLRSRSFLSSANKKYIEINRSMKHSTFRKANLPLSLDATVSPITSKQVLYKKPVDSFSYHMRHFTFLK